MDVMEKLNIWLALWQLVGMDSGEFQAWNFIESQLTARFFFSDKLIYLRYASGQHLHKITQKKSKLKGLEVYKKV